MHSSPEPQYTVTQDAIRKTAAESFGRVARCTPVQLAPGHLSANDADISSRSELDAMALRAQSANGFGDADAATVALPARPSIDFAPGDSQLLYRTAGMRNLIADCSRWVVVAVRAFIDEWNRHRQAHATYRALCGLDARMLRDIGIHRSEVLSVATEISGAIEATRVHAVPANRGL